MPDQNEMAPPGMWERMKTFLMGPSKPAEAEPTGPAPGPQVPDPATASKLYGADLGKLNPAMASVMEAILNAANYPRYGMSEADRSQLIGRLPGSPSYGPAAERFTSGYLFARQNPSLVGVLGAANKFTDWLYGTNLAPQAIAGAEAFAKSGQNPMDPNAMTPLQIAKQEDKRKTDALLKARAARDTTQDQNGGGM